MKIIFELGPKETTGFIDITVGGAPESIAVGDMVHLPVMPEHLFATITRKVWIGGAERKLLYHGTIPLNLFEVLLGNKELQKCDW